MNDWVEWIEVENVQTIPKFRFDLPQEGIVKFSGDNNDGKSILRKFIFDIIGCQLHLKDNRYCLINDNQEYATCTIHRNSGMELYVYAHREASKTYYELRIPSQQPIKRYLKDKGLETLIYDMGFHYLSKRDFSLNVHPANTPNLFETTSSICNKEAYDSATEDLHLNQAIESVENIIIEIKEQIDEHTNKLAIAQSKINTSILIEEREALDNVVKLQKLLKAIDSIYPMDMKDLHLPKDVKYLRDLSTLNVKYYLENFSLPSKEVGNLIKNIKILQGIQPLSDISKSMHDYLVNKKAYDEEKCPVCGRSVFNDSCKI